MYSAFYYGQNGIIGVIILIKIIHIYYNTPDAHTLTRALHRTTRTTRTTRALQYTQYIQYTTLYNTIQHYVATTTLWLHLYIAIRT